MQPKLAPKSLVATKLKKEEIVPFDLARSGPKPLFL
jgi:hypothetical protein